LTLLQPNESVSRRGREKLERAYESIWREYGASLDRLAASYEAAPDGREDLLQEIRLALWKALPGFRGECSLRTFVYRVAHNRALTHAWQRRTQSRASEEFSEIPDPAPSAEVSAIRQANRASLMAAIRRLPLDYRQVITMVLEQMPQAEIAAVLGISETNVAVRLHRARKLLRRELGGIG
jgi:RNA polymerase sigma factor (sigma-70 family)